MKNAKKAASGPPKKRRQPAAHRFRRIAHFIGGEFVAPKGEEQLAVINPANGAELGTAPVGSEAAVALAVAAASSAFQSRAWRKMTGAQRGQMLHDIADALRTHAWELAELETANTGKTVREALDGDLPACADIFDYYAGWAAKIEGETIPVAGPYLNYTRREPIGVCGLITPWNYPLLIACWKIAPALACGNTVVLKPSEWAPMTAFRFAEIARDCGVPDGVINIVFGTGEITGAALASHDGVRKIAFTGSVATARSIAHSAADSNLKRLSLELGGKSAHIIFDDARMEDAIRGAAWGIYSNQGEVCSAGSRILVQESVCRDVTRRLAKIAKGLRIGDPMSRATQVGPLISEQHLRSVISYIDTGVAEGARLLCGGRRATARACRAGYFVEPTLFEDVHPQMSIAQEEIFGPVAVIMPFRDESHAVEIANATAYGLAAGVWTQDVGRAHRVAHALEAGTVWVNCYNQFDSASPFGGVKISGYGREMGRHALDLYTQVKSIWVALEN